MIEGLKLWTERFEIEPEQGKNEVRVCIKLYYILLGWVEPDQFPARVFKIAFMLRRDREFMTLEELDCIAVYLNYIHMKPLSESGARGSS